MINWGHWVSHWVSQLDTGRAATCGTGELPAFMDGNLCDLTRVEVLLVRKPQCHLVPRAQPRRHRCGNSFHQGVTQGGRGLAPHWMRRTWMNVC